MNADQIGRVEHGTACRVCGRVLKNPVHVAAGIGPICAKKSAVKMAAHSLDKSADYTGLSLGQRSRYLVAKVEPAMVWIRDVGHNEARPSVTNDADNVVRELYERFGNRRFIYQDSMGRWDELRHNNGHFFAYWPGQEFALEAA